MDQNSHAGSSAGGPDWGTMGGSVGDGFLRSGADPAPPPGQPPPQQQQPPQPKVVPPPGRGGGTSQSSYAARAAAAHASYQTTTNSAVPSIQTNTTTPGGSGGSFAARAAQAYGQQQQQPSGDATDYSSPAGYAPPNTYGQQQQPSPGGYGQLSNYGQPSYQQQQQPPQQQKQPNMASSTYSQASTFSQQQPGYNQGYQQQQPQPQQVSPVRPPAPTAGYAARAAQAYAQQPSPQAYNSQPQQQTPQGYNATPTASSPYKTQPRGYGNQTPPVPLPAQPTYNTSGGQSLAGQSTIATQSVTPSGMPSPQRPGMPNNNAQGALPASLSPAVQQRLLADATRKVQEHAYYMKQAMEQKQLPMVLERAAYMVGELGGLPHGAQPTTQPAVVSLSNTGLSAQLTPKNYYELYMRALEDMPALEEHLRSLAQKQEPTPLAPDQIQIVMEAAPTQPTFKMRELYDCVQYCPRVLPRLYLQIAAGSAMLRAGGEIGAKWMLDDLLQAVKCEQNPIRGLFLRNYLLTALRDQLPDGPLPVPSESMSTPERTSEDETDKPAADVDPEMDPGNVIDSYEFVLANFMEMNKLWVRLQHMPGEGHIKEVKIRRQRERNELRILVGTNLVRLSQLEGVTSKIYGESILPRILEHIVLEGDPLSQAYLMDCLVQVFPDEYHIETMPILLGVCPRLRDKVNIRTILLGLMDRLANYLAEEELLDESDTNQVKLTLARDSFGMFEDCVQKVYNARGPKLTAREVIRLQTALLQFSLKCYPGNLEQITQCMSACVSALHQANASYEMTDATMVNVPPKQLDSVAVVELEKLLSIPLDSLALQVLQLQHFGQLIAFLPWSNRRGVAIKLLEAVDQAGSPPHSILEIQQLFQLIEPLLRDEGNHPGPAMQGGNTTAQATSLMANLGVSSTPAPAFESSFIEDSSTPLEQVEKEAALVSKLIHLLDHPNTDVLYEMFTVARRGVKIGGRRRIARILASLVIAGLKLIRRVAKADSTIKQHVEATPEAPKETVQTEESKDDGASSPEDSVPEEETKPQIPEDVEEDGANPEDAEGDGANPEEAKEEATEITTDEVETKVEKEEDQPQEMMVSCRQIFVFVQETIRNLGKANAEAGVKMYLEAATVADSLAQEEGKQTVYSPVAYEMLSQGYSLYEESISDSKVQLKCVTAMIGTLMACGGLPQSDYESLITKSAQLSAKLVKKPDQCRMVALCAHLFFPASKGESFGYRNAQRSLECLQRSLKLADSCTSANPSNVDLFVELLEHYLYLFEKKSPTISAGYITGLVSLIKEHLNNLSGSPGVLEAKKHFVGIIRDIKRKKSMDGTAPHFANVQVDNIGA
uniref:Vacuolar protein sorting-associated protein 35 n=1 Tax=Amphora coffeiformis TaxID=265554 RepID=A0A7S3LID7_9STRA|mmetsp:Transcript_12639/g.25595  ORF Transcript_12639/g.25595 Transcript_12639/m.25595 type:complete len:1338 (+) Transcript_12639:377-4390(+)|eukprot:scaffold3028_cov174-Amphora_coffeaeformis.AAC.20